MKQIKQPTYNEAVAAINADKDLKARVEELRADYESGQLDHGFAWGNFFNLAEDESKVVIQWLDPDDQDFELIADSIEQAVVAIRGIEETYA